MAARVATDRRSPAGPVAGEREAGRTATRSVAPGGPSLRERSLDFEQALLAVDRARARRVLEAGAGAALGVCLDGIVVPALDRIGRGWEAGEVALSQVYMPLPGAPVVTAAWTPLSRTLAALSHQEADRPPVFLLLTMHGARELGLSLQACFSRAGNLVEGQLRLRRRFNGVAMARWTAAEAGAAARRALDAAGPGGGFILADDHGEVPFQVADEVLHALVQAAVAWGQGRPGRV